MRYYTKEWYKLLQFLGTVELFEPVMDKEYTDEEIEELYQEMLEKHIQEERDLYDEPPVLDLDEWKEENPEDEFDPDNYMIADFDEDGEEVNFRNPETYQELLQYQVDEYEMLWREFEDRPPFDEEEAAEEFEENYNDSLEEPDEDIPEWVLETVDHRLLAMGLMPESAYKKLRAEDEECQNRFDELEELADREYETMIEDFLEGDEDLIAEVPEGMDPDHIAQLIGDLNDLEGAYVLDVKADGDDIEFEMLGWDDEGDEVKIVLAADNCKIIEHESLTITVETDEDGDVSSDCELTAHELYWSPEGLELHLMFDNNGLKYVTLSCEDVTCMRKPSED